MKATATINAYYWLTKPGIIYGNALTAAAGYFLAASLLKDFDVGTFAAMLIGTSLVIGSACVVNNFLDRDIDPYMTRTKKRASVTGKVTLGHGLIYAAVLGIAGALVLALFTNWLTVSVGLVGAFFYLVLYTYFKRRSSWGTVVGSVSGATPIVAGYVAATNNLDGAALIIFLMMIFWQMPHFYAIAIYRSNDYKAAKIPVLPLVKGNKVTLIHILGYVVAFILASVSLTIFGYSGYVYLLVMAVVGLWWLKLGVDGFKAENTEKWAKRMFLRSLVVVSVLSFAVAFGALLP